VNSRGSVSGWGGGVTTGNAAGLRWIAFAMCFAGVACSTVRPEPPSADVAQAPFPGVTGRSVMLLPLQAATPLVATPAAADTSRAPALLAASSLRAFDAELAFWLQERANGTTWVDAAAVERAAERSPMLDVRPRELPVRDFQRARLTSIGDPLFGNLHALSALLDARLALLPIGALWIEEQGGGGRIHVALALIDAFGGRVLWQGVVAGGKTAANDAAALAAAARAVADVVSR